QREFPGRHPAERGMGEGARRHTAPRPRARRRGNGDRRRPRDLRARPPLLTPARTEKERSMGYFDYLKHGRKMLMKRGQMPVYLVYFITDACNAKCKHCLLADGAHPGWEEPSMTYRKQELSLEEIDKVSASMGKGSLMFLLPTGGEPFLRKDIGEIVKIFHKNTGVRNVGIPTNGSTTARTVSIVKDLCESCPDLDLHIDVSLDGVGELHDEIRVFPGLFKRSIETYKALRDVEKHHKN